MTRARWWWIGAALAGALVATSSARAAEVVDEQVDVLVRALSYDRHFGDRVGDKLKIGVLWVRGDEASAAEAGEVFAALVARADARIQDRVPTVVSLDYTSIDALRAAFSAEQVDIVVLCAGLDADLSLIIELCGQQDVLTIALDEGYVRRGAALGTLTLEGRQRVLVNLPASREEGAEFSSELLQLAEVIP